MSKLKAKLAAQIQANGPLSLADYMDAALSDPEEGYYMRRAPFGKPHDGGGDFTTAPEISQMFGELVGAWCLDLWARSGPPQPVNLVELGPGRGTLMADICRTTGQNSDFTQHLNVHFVETSRTLRAKQKQRVPNASWHDSIATLPKNAMMLVIANEFFDALPITQYARTQTGWREITVSLENNELAFARGPEQKNPFSPVQATHLPNTAPEEIVEASPVRELVMQDLCAHLKCVR
ncbi:MAG: SAM-dependent methyltransferase, partial [Pseudomonadota bacterium]|nr:SAM-dependent methyltransferase [Pseudomonadota bacterium]